ncbi:probable pectinesterase/pectinesterase inhibitor 12 [Lycium barbarum]|uniref:probable pectinesterase/pectinesterase inhibitor 12 n=1 Tax=Lycium barbarum TaxID=112863 RepID=UPI00293F1FC9|nr:probable pectinesterase/pectinesterase inhibitor 12 [Lycium barbarum]
MSHVQPVSISKIIPLSLCCEGCQQTAQPPYAVAQDGSSNYNTMIDAGLTAPNNNIVQYYIQTKQGTYNEYVQIEEWQTNIVLIGEGMDKTIISRNKSFGGGIGTYHTTTMACNSTCIIDLMTVCFSLLRVSIRRFQDSLYTDFGKQFYTECKILGTIDFICGDAAGVFQNCLIEARIPLHDQYITITTQQRNIENEPT